MCLTPIHEDFEETVVIQVVVTVGSVTLPSICTGSCVFTYRGSVTPYATYVSLGSTQEQPLRVIGALKGTLAVRIMIV